MTILGTAVGEQASEGDTAQLETGLEARAFAGKPRLRGVSHQVSFFIALAATVALSSRTRTHEGTVAVLVFGATLVLVFGTSACYHRIDWTPLARARMRRLDHAAIFMLIGGGYTPLFLLVPSPQGGHRALLFIWTGAVVGIVKSIAWAHAPKWLTAALCVGLGWMVVLEVLSRTRSVGPKCIYLLVASGLTYSIGAVVYALRRPDPYPRTFGYHEVFHLLVCTASAFLFAHVALVVRAMNA